MFLDQFFHTFVQKSIKERKQVADYILIRYPDRIPVLLDIASKSSFPLINKHRFLVPGDITVGGFLYEIRKHIAIKADQSIFLFVNNTLPPTAQLISDVYNIHKNEDSFLYITYSSENVFG